MRSATVLTATAALLICGAQPVTAIAEGVSERATLQASFTPDRLGASTTIGFSFQLATAEGLAPPPLSAIHLHMPAGVNYTTTTLGLAICQPASLLANGLGGCSPNSRLGYGSAYVEVPFGNGAGQEIPEIQALEGPSSNGNLVVLFYAFGRSPISAQLVFRGEVLPASGRFGAELAIVVPPVPSVPEGPDVSIIRVSATIGPRHLTYYKHVHGRLVPFHPIGVSVPEHCPRGGFPFSADFTFLEGSHASASTSVPCPHRR